MQSNSRSTIGRHECLHAGLLFGRQRAVPNFGVEGISVEWFDVERVAQGIRVDLEFREKRIEVLVTGLFQLSAPLVEAAKEAFQVPATGQVHLLLLLFG